MAGQILDSDLKLLPLHKRRIALPFKPGASASSAPDTSLPWALPAGTGNVSTVWKVVKVYLDVRNPNASATTAQLYFSGGGNTPFGAGTAVCTAADGTTATPVSVSGTSSYQQPAAGLSASSQSLATGTLLAAAFPSLGGSNVTLFVELEEV